MNKLIPQIFVTLFVVLLSTTNIACAQKAPASSDTNQNEGKVISLTDETFKTLVFDYSGENAEWKYLGKKPAIIDFYADWCGPCRKIAPIMEELAKDYKGQIIVYKVNVDNAKALASWMQIQSIPAVLFVPQEGTPQMMVGQNDKATYQSAIQDLLLKKK